MATLQKKSFSSLPEDGAPCVALSLQDVQEQIREKQRQAQAKKKASQFKGGSKAALQAKKSSGQASSAPAEVERTQLTMEERSRGTCRSYVGEDYFGACRAGVFQQEGFEASEQMLEHLLSH